MPAARGLRIDMRSNRYTFVIRRAAAARHNRREWPPSSRGPPPRGGLVDGDDLLAVGARAQRADAHRVGLARRLECLEHLRYSNECGSSASK